MKRLAVVLLLLATSLVYGFRSEVRVVQDVEFLAPGSLYKMDLYLPAPPAEGSRSPAIVWIHGGGWAAGNRRGPIDVEVCRTLAEAGYVVASAGYHLGEGSWPQNLRDCKIAVRFLRKFAERYGVDPGRIGVAGSSAGGHLALMVGLTSNVSELEPKLMYPGVSDEVRCVVDFYGPSDLRPSALANQPAMQSLMAHRGSTFGADPSVLAAASPVNYVRPDSPPVLILHGRNDKTVDAEQSEELAQRLKSQGVPYEAVFLDGVGHSFNFEGVEGRPLPRDVRPVVLAFLAKYLGGRR